MKKTKDVDGKKFYRTEIDDSIYNDAVSFDLHRIYDSANRELAMQQSKRDQLIVIFLAMCSFLLPFALSQDSISWELKGFLFITIGIIGIIFCLIAIRYKIYKEIYWMSCQTISVMQNIKKEKLKKDIIQTIFYDIVAKKGKKFIVTTVNGEEKTKKFSKWKYMRKNLFSAETLYFIVLDFITAIISGFGLGLVFPFQILLGVIVGIAYALIIFIGIFIYYNYKVSSIFNVLSDGSDASFNSIFEKAWHLHIY